MYLPGTLSTSVVVGINLQWVDHLTKGQQAAILSVMRYSEDKGSASPVADTVEILGLGRSRVYKVKTQIHSPRTRGPTTTHSFQRVDDFQRKLLQRVIYDTYNKIK